MDPASDGAALSAWAVAHIAPTAPAKLNAMIRFIPKALRFAKMQQIKLRRSDRLKFSRVPDISLSAGVASSDAFC
jgi:hypothetical protein